MKQHIKTGVKSYFGGKGTCFRHIANQVPPHRKKMIGFLGNCALSRHMQPAERNICFDRDPAVIKAWEKGKSKLSPQEKNKWSFFQADFIQYLKTWKAHQDWWTNDVFLYLDPTYPEETLSSDNKYNFVLSDGDHITMLQLAKQIPANIAISTYPNPIYESELKDWRYIEFESMTRGGWMATERLYMNYPDPEQLHDYSFYGENFREREVVNRKLKTQFGKIEKMPAIERKVFINRMKERYPLAFLGDGNKSYKTSKNK